MKKVLLLFSFFIITACSKNLYTSYTTNSNNILIDKLDNILTFKNLDKNVEFSIDNGKITKISKDSFNIIVDSIEYTKVYLKKGKRTDTIEFNVQALPKPKFLAFSNKYSWKEIESLSISEFQNIEHFSPFLPNYNYYCTFKIVSFDVIKIDKFDNIKATKIIGHKPDNKLSSMIENAKMDDTFIFYNIKIKFLEINKEIYTDNVIVKLK